MLKLTPIRRLMLAGLIACVSASACAQRRGGRPAPRPAPIVRAARRAQGARMAPGPRAYQQQQNVAPIERRAPAPVVRPGGAVMGPNPAAPGAKGEHLADWMTRHNTLSPGEQQQALEREPGFRQLSPEVQQRERNQLARLNAMPQEQRQRTLERTEAMERLSPDQRLQVRGAMQQLGGLPQDQRQVVARNFRELRGMTPEQRTAAFNSDRYSNLNPEQRATLNRLMQVEPMLPPR